MSFSPKGERPNVKCHASVCKHASIRVNKFQYCRMLAKKAANTTTVKSFLSSLHSCRILLNKNKYSFVMKVINRRVQDSLNMKYIAIIISATWTCWKFFIFRFLFSKHNDLHTLS